MSTRLACRTPRSPCRRAWTTRRARWPGSGRLSRAPPSRRSRPSSRASSTAWCRCSGTARSTARSDASARRSATARPSPATRRRRASMSRSIRPRGASTTSFTAWATRPATPRQCASTSNISSSRSFTMAERRSFPLAALSLAGLGLTAPAKAADMAPTPPAQPYVAPAPVAVPVTTTAPPARDNSLIVMPIPPQPSPATVDAAARQTGNPINKPVTGAAIEPEVVGGEKPLSLESLQATRPGSGLAADGLEPGRQDILYQSGLAYGARGGLAARAFAINEMLRRYESTLDSVYNFDDVIQRRPGSQIIMRPPVISEAEMALALGDGGQIARETACVYSISKVAQLGSAPPNWRTYLVRTWEQPSRPADAVLPRTDEEVQYWNKYVAEGWARANGRRSKSSSMTLDGFSATSPAWPATGCCCAQASSPNRTSRRSSRWSTAAAANSGRATGSSPSRRNRASGRTPAYGAARAIARSEGTQCSIVPPVSPKRRMTLTSGSMRASAG